MQKRLDDLIRKNITVYFDDKSSQGVGRKDGIFLEMTHGAILLENTRGHREIIPLGRIIRIVERNKWSG